MSKNINHVVSGNNFHGNYRILLRGPKDGFVLSKSQAKKYSNALCGCSDCKCGGGYGDGPDAGSPLVHQSGWDELYLDAVGDFPV